MPTPIDKPQGNRFPRPGRQKLIAPAAVGKTSSDPTPGRRIPSAPAAQRIATSATVMRTRKVGGVVASSGKAAAPLSPRKRKTSRISKFMPADVSPPQSRWRSLSVFESVDDVIAAINRARAVAVGNSVRFAWARAAQDPEIPITSLGVLTDVVFGDIDSGFIVEELLASEIEKLPSTVIEEVKIKLETTMHLESLRIVIPEATKSALPQLGVAVSVALNKSKPTLGPFSLHRIYLKIGSFNS